MMNSALLYASRLHVFFVFILFLATLLFIVWVIKFAKKEELRKWIIGLFIVGLLGCLITISIGVFGYGNLGWGNETSDYGPGLMNGKFLACSQNQECNKSVNELMDRMMGGAQ